MNRIDRIADLARRYLANYEQGGPGGERDKLIGQLHQATEPQAPPPPLGVHVAEKIKAKDVLR